MTALPSNPESLPRRPRVVLLDGNTPCVSALFRALSRDADVYTFRVVNPSQLKASWRDLYRWRDTQPASPGFHEQTAMIPGWTRGPALSGRILRQRVASLVRRAGPLDLVVYTLPQYADVAARLDARTRAYLAFDPYDTYENWDTQRIRAQQRQILSVCDIAFGVSRKLCEDMQAQSSRARAVYLPNAVERSLVDALAGPRPACPADLAALGPHTVGCVGLINNSYDWEFIEAIAAGVPEATFVFIGRVIESDPDHCARIERIMARPNIKCLGYKPPAQLAVYLANLGMCLCPLRLNPINDRRSPLRLYDYLATDRPILSTAVAEAYAHAPHVEVAPSADEAIACLRRFIRGQLPVDVPSRRVYVAENTWDARAGQLLSAVEPLWSGAAPAGAR